MSHTKWIACLAAGVLVSVPCRSSLALDIVKDGKPLATIVLPDKPTVSDQEAAKQIVENLRLCTGATLPVAPEAQAPAEGTLVSIGKTAAADKLNLNVANQIADTYFLRVQDRTLFLIGRDDEERHPGDFGNRAHGTLAAAFAFLRNYAGVRWVMPTANGVWNPQTQNISVPDDLNRKVEPVILFDGLYDYPWGFANGSREAVRLAQADSHTWWYAFPNLDELRTKPDVPDREAKIKAAILEFAAANPTVYAEIDGKRQNTLETMFRGANHSQYNPMICTSHPDFVQNMAKWVRQKFDQGEDIVPLGQSDGLNVCQCAECMKRFGDPKTDRGWAMRIYGPHMEVCKLCMQSHPKKIIKLLVYSRAGAWLTNVAAGKEPNPGLQFPPNTLAEITGAIWLDFDQMRHLIPQVCAYEYWWTVAWSGLAPKQNPTSAELGGKMMVDNKALGIYFCNGTGGNWSGDGPTLYICLRAIQEPALDENDLLHEYCAGLYGKAAGTMFHYYQLLCSRVFIDPNNFGSWGFGAEQIPQDHWLGNRYLTFWPEPNLKKMGDLLTKAEGDAKDDQRALNWIRFARVAYDHINLTTAVYRAGRAYEADKTADNLRAIKAPLEAFNDFVKRISDLQKTDPQFVAGYFPQYGRFVPSLKGEKGGGYGEDGSGLGRGVPFHWDLDKLLAEGKLP